MTWIIKDSRPPYYFQVFGQPWVDDRKDAHRFERREDAEAMLRMCIRCLHVGTVRVIRLVPKRKVTDSDKERIKERVLKAYDQGRDEEREAIARWVESLERQQACYAAESLCVHLAAAIRDGEHRRTP